MSGSLWRWETLHPLVVHFPVALLLVAPWLVLPGFCARPRRARPYLVAALVLLAAGAAAGFLAIETGEASAARVLLPAGGEEALDHHARLGRLVPWAAAGVALALAGYLAWSSRRPAPPPAARRAALAAWLAAALAVAGLVAATGTAGGRLVHELGVRALPSGAAD
ncbi:MAG: hypothetical protein KJ058_08265 [Thermoanaerobaculia bacterium]|nr:hypothetical protein [Thermoanaerobaculia bacterium]